MARRTWGPRWGSKLPWGQQQRHKALIRGETKPHGPSYQSLWLGVQDLLEVDR